MIEHCLGAVEREVIHGFMHDFENKKWSSPTVILINWSDEEMGLSGNYELNMNCGV